MNFLVEFLSLTLAAFQYSFLGLFSAEQLCIITGSLNESLLRNVPQRLAPVIASVVPRLRLTSTFAAGTLLVCTAAIIRRQCYRTLGRFFTFDLALRKEHKLVTSGPYSVVRHPAYTGAILFVLGARMCLHDDGSLLHALGVWDSLHGKILECAGHVLAALAIFSFVGRVKKEDEALKNEFGQEWEEWARRTPWRLIPDIW